MAEANVARKVESTKRKNAAQGIIAPVGKRMFDLSKLAKDMWCSVCEIPLSFRLLESEQQYGLASVFKIRCGKCLELYQIASSSTAQAPDDSQPGRCMYSANLKLVLGKCITYLLFSVSCRMQTCSCLSVHATLPSDIDICFCCMLGCIDAGIGYEQLSKLLSTANLPTMARKTFKRAEERVGPCIVDVAQGSCVEAIAEEKALSVKRR